MEEEIIFEAEDEIEALRIVIDAFGIDNIEWEQG